MSFSSFNPSFEIKNCKSSFENDTNSGKYWETLYDKNLKKCYHNKIESNCKICKWKTINKSNCTEMCPHWISIHEKCYVCERENKRKKYFHNNNIKIKETKNFVDINRNEYINPNDINKKYPSMSENYKTKDNEKNINSFMKRSLDTINFIQRNNNSNIWANPIANSSFPSVHISNKEIENTYLGISTRGSRKLDNTDFNNDLHLRRSMLQPDFRHGNRFYENKPTNTRRESYRRLGNENVRKFQDQTEKMYKEMTYTKAYDKAAGINRG